METELSFQHDGQPLSITFNAVPESGFFQEHYRLRCIRVVEYSSSERGWKEGGRFVVELNDDDGVFECRVECDGVRWDDPNVTPEFSGST